MHDHLSQVRQICFSFPEITERTSHGSSAFFIREKKTLAMYRPDEEPPAIWCPAPEDALHYWKNVEPDMFYYPPYMGHYGWLGIRLTGSTDWDLVNLVLRDAFIKVAPRKLLKILPACVGN